MNLDEEGEDRWLSTRLSLSKPDLDVKRRDR